ncbi:class I SAM-dependent methyltransferase [Roseivirga sp. BDSF3-8]|uniref:class I SAM-dependent methyltransferase n=1 Tax=Roseivirga sp. BDSF3-8 TaxID=3241598 RepID=UPI003532268A
MKDLFSGHAKDYATYRPGYPEELYAFIFSQCPGLNRVWDCGTGNGQAAIKLAKTFREVEATDISRQQLSNAVAAENIHYHVNQAEETSFEDKSFDLITVAQALHWFDFSGFFREVSRVCKKDGLLACWGYELLNIDEETDAVIHRFYASLEPYWQPERKHIESCYASIPFPYEMNTRHFTQKEDWNLSGLCNYLNTWSAVKKAAKETGRELVEEVRKELSATWPEDEIRGVTFPVFLLYGHPNS